MPVDIAVRAANHDVAINNDRLEIVMSFPKMALILLGAGAVLAAGCTVETTRSYEGRAEAPPRTAPQSSERMRDRSERTRESSYYRYHESRTHGRIYTTTAGQPLYFSQRDRAGQSRCYGECARMWPPYHASRNARAEGRWSIVDRRDGTRQWAYDGRPVYTWSGDREPGTVTGHGHSRTWSVLQVSVR